jgi:hypothetical protein
MLYLLFVLSLENMVRTKGQSRKSSSAGGTAKLSRTSRDEEAS